MQSTSRTQQVKRKLSQFHPLNPHAIPLLAINTHLGGLATENQTFSNLINIVILKDFERPKFERFFGILYHNWFRQFF